MFVFLLLLCINPSKHVAWWLDNMISDASFPTSLLDFLCHLCVSCNLSNQKEREREVEREENKMINKKIKTHLESKTDRKQDENK